MQVKIFSGLRTDVMDRRHGLNEIEDEVNAWLKAHPKVKISERQLSTSLCINTSHGSSVKHAQVTIVIWYTN